MTYSYYSQEESIDFYKILAACELMIERYTVEGLPMWESTYKEIEQDPIGRARRLQKELNVGDTMHNRVKCRSCNEVIESMHRHDFVSCKCAGAFVDGGSWYGRCGGKEIPELMFETWPWVENE